MTTPSLRRPLLSLVVPVYNESEVLSAFYARAVQALDSIADCDTELLFVDDGSTDDSGAQIEGFIRARPGTRLLRLSRNFGHQAAITAGLDRAHGDCVVTLDADLQDPPELIPELYRKWCEGYDVVFAVRTDRRSDSAPKRVTAAFFYRLFNLLGGMRATEQAGDFRLLSRRVVDVVQAMPERNRYLRGLVSWLGFRQTSVGYRRTPREGGRSKFTVGRMTHFAVDAITSFSTTPLRLATWLGFAASVLAFLYLMSVFVQKLQGITVQGWATIMVAVLFLGGVQLICLGIIGEYLGRVFSEVKHRPIYIVESEVGESPRASTAPPVMND